MIRRGFLAGLATVAVATAATAVVAHRGHHTLSIVDIGAGGKITVTHVLSAHDTEPELVELAPGAQPSLDDPDALAALEDHLAAAFTVNGAVLKLVSTDFKGDDLVLVYEGRLPARPKSVTVGYGLFPASESRPVGMVNVHRDGITKSLHFHTGDAAKNVSF